MNAKDKSKRKEDYKEESKEMIKMEPIKEFFEAIGPLFGHFTTTREVRKEIREDDGLEKWIHPSYPLTYVSKLVKIIGPGSFMDITSRHLMRHYYKLFRKAGYDNVADRIRLALKCYIKTMDGFSRYSKKRR